MPTSTLPLVATIACQFIELITHAIVVLVCVLEYVATKVHRHFDIYSQEDTAKFLKNLHSRVWHNTRKEALRAGHPDARAKEPPCTMYTMFCNTAKL